MKQLAIPHSVFCVTLRLLAALAKLGNFLLIDLFARFFEDELLGLVWVLRLRRAFGFF